jgi:lipopolysaccharide biosynthesis glycosyltransferase
MEVWFSIDARTSECGFVAAASLLTHRAKQESTSIRVAYVKGEKEPASWWPKRLKELGYRFDFDQVGIDLGGLSDCKGLFDSHAAYLRLLIPHFSRSETIVYSDADVVFQEDLEGLLQETNLGNSLMGLIKAGPCSLQPEPEKDLLRRYGKNDNDDYFFSGLAIINNALYKKNNICEKAIQFADQYSKKLSFHDQTIWNCVIERAENLESRWCHLAYPGDKKPYQFTGGIVHFVGSPKPWDLLGELKHPYSGIWVDAAKKAGLSFPRLRKYGDPENWRRAYRIRNQYKCWI